MARKSIAEQRTGFKPKRSVVDTSIMADQPVDDWKRVSDKIRLSPPYRLARDVLSKIDAGGVAPVPKDPIIVNSDNNHVVNNREYILAAFDLDIQRAEVLLVDSEDVPNVYVWQARNRRQPRENVDFYVNLYEDDD